MFCSQCPTFSSHLAPSAVRMDGALPSRAEPPGLSSSRRENGAPTPHSPSLASSTRRAVWLKHGQNINCGYPWGIRLHVIPNTLFFFIFVLIFIYNEHMT